MEKIMEILSDPQMIALIIGAAVFVFFRGEIEFVVRFGTRVRREITQCMERRPRRS